MVSEIHHNILYILTIKKLILPTLFLHNNCIHTTMQTRKMSVNILLYSDMGGLMLKILLILAALAFIYLIWVVVAFIIAFSRESQMPDIEDVELAEEI
jgi:uncharacterized membrane protein